MRWWHRPYWMLLPKNKWPTSNVNLNFDIPQQRTLLNFLIVVDNLTIFPELILKYSSFNKLLRVTSYVLRFINNYQKKSTDKLIGLVTPKELENSLLLLTKVAQIGTFQREYNDLLQNKTLNKKSTFLSLNPFMHNNVMRVGERLQKSYINLKEIHQLILPKGHHLTYLILLNGHTKLLHCGVQALICSIRQKFCI